MHLFHCPHIDLPELELPEDEAHHALHVLRLREGAEVGLLDGRGGLAHASIARCGKRSVLLHVQRVERTEQERRHAIHLAVAPTKTSDRFEWFVEKAVEIGVDRIVPIATERTERSHLRVDRLERVAVSAMKQSQRRWLPQIAPLTPLNELLAAPLPPQRLFGWCEGQHAPLMDVYTPTSEVLLLIGPEGDFSVAEAEQLRTAGFAAVSIGNARLRTETAALAACTWMSLAQQRS
ncbi:MAG: RsmE family RNA methyltransferase [Flavobacteriales bacterium]